MQESMGNPIGPNFKKEQAGILEQPNRSKCLQRGCRDLRTAESVQIFEGLCRNQRTAEFVRILKKGMQGSTDSRIGLNF